MYRVNIIGPDLIAVRTLYINSELTSKQEEELLKPFPECFIDISRHDLELAQDELSCWDDEDYYNLFDPPNPQYGQVFSNGKFRPDYRKVQPQ